MKYSRLIYICIILMLVSFALALLAVPAHGQTTKPASGFRLEDGTPVKLRLQKTLSSKDAVTGETVDFDVVEEIMVNGVLVIPKGSVALGTVTDAEHKKHLGRGGKLDVNIDSVRLADGEKAQLRGVKDVKGGGHTGAMTGAMVATAIVVWPAAPLFLFMHGKDISIPKGTEITAYVNGDTNLDPAKFSAQAQVGNEALAFALIFLASSPPYADITVDGRYVGGTPATLKLPAGDHLVAVTMSGYTAWKRMVSFTAGSSLNVLATLEPSSAPQAASQ